MKKRFLGLDIGTSSSYLTLIEYENNELKKVSFFVSRLEELSDQLTELRQNFSGPFKIGDRLAVALPAKSVYVRKFELPFRDPKKVAASIPFSLGAQIPVSVEDCVTSTIINSNQSDGLFKVTAAAIPKQVVEDILAAAQLADLPLHILDLPPFSLVPLVAESKKDAILIAVNSQETTISLIQSGELTDYRLLPKKIEPENINDIQSISREIRALMANSGDVELPTLIVGDVDSGTLSQKLDDIGYEAKELELRLAGEVIPAPFFHATALAYRAAETKAWKSFNFRSGDYALRGEWQKLKRALLVTAGLTIVSVLIIAAAAVVQYQSKANQVDTLQNEMSQIFQQTFPATTAIVDIPLQMKSSIRELHEKMVNIGGSQAQILSILKVLSEATMTIPIEVQELSVGSGEVKVNGTALSFDEINKMTELLTQSSIVENVQIAEAQMAISGDKVNFRLFLEMTPNR
ncbi:MAG: type II secretion system protein GspL [Deltaproteobacteria bacterium]|nr:type II secretion system protein GspL [Deltaproteobacteria bacterium]